ncbi:hypothetical protein BJV82DRAFT_241762 [Fennellomyces sp. T-0311]|nr:hypothetical protein BJV82DRAFT_241762 [Fennellomyces sp. T-0311]
MQTLSQPLTYAQRLPICTLPVLPPIAYIIPHHTRCDPGVGHSIRWIARHPERILRRALVQSCSNSRRGMNVCFVTGM